MRTGAKILIAVAALWTLGLFGFVVEVSRTVIPEAEAATAGDGADAVVVFTGAGGERIPTAMQLFAGGAGERLLISGVHPNTDRQAVAAFWPGAFARFSCCVDLGREARTTRGNALESAAWTAAHEFGSVVLVTSDYHMPRALLEWRHATPNVAVAPHAVRSVFMDADGRPASLGAWRVLTIEYTKYLAVRLKTLF
ncbi:MAG: YdcF family protein [Pseudomonadota bacterium]